MIVWFAFWVFGRSCKCVKNVCFLFFSLFVFWGVVYFCLFGSGGFRVRWGPKRPTSPNPSFLSRFIFSVFVFLVCWFCFCCFCLFCMRFVVGMFLVLSVSLSAT